MPKFEYAVKLSVDLGGLLAPVGDMLKHVNDEMASLGHNEKLMVRSKCISINITTERELTKKDKDLMKKAIVEPFNKAEPAWRIQVESFRRKPGNVQQSVA